MKALYSLQSKSGADNTERIFACGAADLQGLGRGGARRRVVEEATRKQLRAELGAAGPSQPVPRAAQLS
jgi:hypothetical protein